MLWPNCCFGLVIAPAAVGALGVVGGAVFVAWATSGMVKPADNASGSTAACHGRSVRFNIETSKQVGKSSQSGRRWGTTRQPRSLSRHTIAPGRRTQKGRPYRARTRGPDSLIATVCSKYAGQDPSVTRLITRRVA